MCSKNKAKEAASNGYQIRHICATSSHLPGPHEYDHQETIQAVAKEITTTHKTLDDNHFKQDRKKMVGADVLIALIYQDSMLVKRMEKLKGANTPARRTMAWD